MEDVIRHIFISVLTPWNFMYFHEIIIIIIFKSGLASFPLVRENLRIALNKVCSYYEICQILLSFLMTEKERFLEV